MRADVVVVGGGIVGFATALQLRLTSPGTSVVVIEKDPTYERAATGKGTGGIRQLFTRPETSPCRSTPWMSLKIGPNGPMFRTRQRRT